MFKNRVNGFIRISKKAARKRYEAGQDIIIIPCKCAPGNPWFIGCTLFHSEGRNFDQFVNEWCSYSYNTDPLLGRYPAFYVKEDNK